MLDENNVKLLSEIAQVRTGLVLARKKAEEHDENAVRYPLLSMKSIKDNGMVDPAVLETFYATGTLNEEYVTHEGDIIVRLTAPFTAAEVGANAEGIVVPTNFAIIRIKNKTLEPGYLVWYLNTSGVKRDIASQTTGHAVVAIRPHFFSNLQVTIPDMKKQQLIAEFYHYSCEENEIVSKLLVLRKSLNDLYLQRSIQQLED